MPHESSRRLIARYLEDAIAAERSFEIQLRTFAKLGDQPDIQAVFDFHAHQTRKQYERLTARLECLGDRPSATKGFLAHLFGMASNVAQAGQEGSENTTQHLIVAYAIEHAEVALYEALAAVAAAAGDAETERLAREIQEQERATAERIWHFLPRSAREALYSASGERGMGA
jgi:ferritin-like metal-binding protein YciE